MDAGASRTGEEAESRQFRARAAASLLEISDLGEVTQNPQGLFPLFKMATVILATSFRF